MKKCIFYLPYQLDATAARARMVRPRKMIKAFKDIGYEVFEITGYAAERKKKIAELKKMIDSGAKFDFMYSEASTMPTLLTEPNHLPTHPFFDFEFFKYLNRNGIKIGLFYPDVYWKYDSYGKNLSYPKRLVAIKNYKYDIKQYEKTLSRFYVPSFGVSDCIASKKLSAIAEELPPGADEVMTTPKDYDNRNFSKDPFTVFYVGGIGAHYQFDELIRAINMTENCRLVLCCREAEWDQSPLNGSEMITEKIQVIHKSGKDLIPYFQMADLASLVFFPSEYIDIAKPVKAFEYLGNELPVLATEGTAIGEFVEENNIGWTVEYDASAIAEKLNTIIAEPHLIEKLHGSIAKAKEKNTWRARARQVCEGLSE